MSDQCFYTNCDTPMEYTKRVYLNLFGTTHHSFIMCLFHRMAYSDMIINDRESDMENEAMENEMESNIYDEIEYRMEYYNEDPMDAVEHSIHDLEYCGRMNARCYYCWLEMEHSNASHDESVTEYSKHSSWPSQPPME